MGILAFDAQGNVIQLTSDQVYNDLNVAPELEDYPDGDFWFPLVITAPNGMKRLVLGSAAILRQPRLLLQQTVDQMSMVIDSLQATDAEQSAQSQIIETTIEHFSQIVADSESLHAQLLAHQTWIDSAITKLDGQQIALTTQANALQTQGQTLAQTVASLNAAVQQINTLNEQQPTLISQLQARKAVVVTGDVTIAKAGLITLSPAIKRLTNLTCTGLNIGDTVLLYPKSLTSGYGIVGWDKTVTVANRVNWVDIQCPILSVGGTDQVLSSTALR